VRKDDDLTTVMCRVSRNSGALTYQKPQRPLGLWWDYFTFTFLTYVIVIGNSVANYTLSLCLSVSLVVLIVREGEGA
jgi:hypothetical protein